MRGLLKDILTPKLGTIINLMKSQFEIAFLHKGQYFINLVSKCHYLPNSIIY